MGATCAGNRARGGLGRAGCRLRDRFLQRHCDAAAEVAAHVRAAADGCTALRDNLWQSVDGKVATASRDR